MRVRKRGRGLVNRIINSLPFELHIPGYQYCGPGTKLSKRLERGDPGINPLDSACKEHDIAYSKNRENLSARHEADKILAERAWKRVFAPDADLTEKAAAWAVVNTMKAKTKLGMGLKDKKKQNKNKRGQKFRNVALRSIIEAAKSAVAPNATTDASSVIKSALQGAREAVRKTGGRRNIRLPRILPVPLKIGGVLPFLIPLFAGLSATGALAGGAATIAKAVNDASAAQRKLAESKRHNETMEAIAIGRGLYMKPYRKGLGLYLKPHRTTTKN